MMQQQIVEEAFFPSWSINHRCLLYLQKNISQEVVSQSVIQKSRCPGSELKTAEDVRMRSEEREVAALSRTP